MKRSKGSAKGSGRQTSQEESMRSLMARERRLDRLRHKAGVSLGAMGKELVAVMMKEAPGTLIGSWDNVL